MRNPLRIVVAITFISCVILVVNFIPALFEDETDLLNKSLYLSSTKVVDVTSTVVDSTESGSAVESSDDTSDSTTLKGDTDADKVYYFLKGKGLSDNAIFGLMGNFKAESNLTFKRLEGDYGSTPSQKTLDFISTVDNGGNTWWYSKPGSSTGFGLIGFTYWSIAKQLVDNAKKMGKSIGDPEPQLETMWELMSAPKFKSYLEADHTLYEITHFICTEYEKPKVDNTNTRYGYAQDLQKEYAGK
jgi:hypothetical protein